MKAENVIVLTLKSRQTKKEGQTDNNKTRGPDVARHYRVTFDNTCSTIVLEGWQLLSQGIVTFPMGAMTSELILIGERPCFENT